MAKRASKKKANKRGGVSEASVSEDDEAVEGYGEVEGDEEGTEGEGAVEEEEEEEGTLHVFEGEPLPVKVGDTFSLASNPGIKDKVTPELLEDLIRRNKALPSEEEGEEGLGDPTNPDTATQHDTQETEVEDLGR